MNCNDIKNILPDYLEGSLSKNDKREIDLHIEECGKCSLLHDQFNQLNNELLNVELIESSDSFKNEFFRKLEYEKYKMQSKFSFYTSFRSLIKIAAAILLFFGGTLFGIIIANQSGGNTKMSILEQEVSQLTQQVHLTALREKTPSEKILAIDYLNTFEVNQDLLFTFSFILNNDESINVRLEAAKALYSLGNSQDARDILINSLNTKQKPIVQINLINYLVEIEKNRIIQPLRELIKDNNTHNRVKEYAQTSLQTII